ncbi:accessory factor UbiK family protein [Notoacmeibacter ruber]|uniref:accessory factor UbiK family protein n=1 Tax=Notoacmeibacter ruber TaxID=2670375 RepID=UPI001FDFE1DB|nr:accessory factor UbiK family protein [Notoacmeibacter ruber]
MDEIARLVTDAAGVAQGARREVETAVRSQAERLTGSLDLVSREEFEAMRDVALRARADAKALENRVAALEARLGADADKGAAASE